jgi:hypothetical protein
VKNNIEKHGNTLTYDVVRASVSKREQFPEDGQVRPKHITIDVILMSFYIKERLRRVYFCLGNGCNIT